MSHRIVRCPVSHSAHSRYAGYVGGGVGMSLGYTKTMLHGVPLLSATGEEDMSDSIHLA